MNTDERLLLSATRQMTGQYPQRPKVSDEYMKRALIQALERGQALAARVLELEAKIKEMEVE